VPRRLESVEVGDGATVVDGDEVHVPPRQSRGFIIPGFVGKVFMITEDKDGPIVKVIPPKGPIRSFRPAKVCRR